MGKAVDVESNFGVLVVNLGTPSSHDPEDVGTFLREFLMDPEVITAPGFVRWPLVNLLIVPRRKFASAANYKKIWMTPEDKSPLLFHSEEFVAKLERKLNKPVALGMRYGDPSLESAYRSLKERGCETIVVFPLFPQYSSATTRTAFNELKKRLMSEQESLVFIRSYSSEQEFVKAQAGLILEATSGQDIEHHVLSFHGLPESLLRKEDPTRSHCLKSKNCCEKACENKQGEHADVFDSCYRAQCHDSAVSIAKSLGWKPGEWTMTFQSRLGPTQWTTPYTSDVLGDLAEKGVKRVSVACPAFPTDCLETLEEIGMGLKEEFLSKGGEKFVLVPCLNSHGSWVSASSEIITKSLNL